MIDRSPFTGAVGRWDGLGPSRPKGPLWLHVSQLLQHAPLSKTKEGLLCARLGIRVMRFAWHGLAV